MNIIKQLDVNIINLIAAGEVVERPKSVIKELVENSIDAKATKIKIEIVDAGFTSIKISDNGVGIRRDDVKIAFLKHTTSKISNEDDLFSISTLGFRGEALSSISAVSRLTIVTRNIDEDIGTKSILEGSNIIDISNYDCNVGTIITVQDLFFNTPARLKFVKSHTKESQLIYDLVQKLILAYPSVSFTYVNNKKTIYNAVSKNDLKTSIFNIYGASVVENLINVDYKGKIDIFGYIGTSDLFRTSKKYQSLITNNRYIFSPLIDSAIKTAYGEMLSSGKFPFYVLHLKINYNEIDVNVHPNKMEVRFSNEQEVYGTFLRAIQLALSENNLVPKFDLTKIESQKSYSYNEKYLGMQGTTLPIKEAVKPIKNTSEIETIKFESIDNLVTFENIVEETYKPPPKKDYVAPETIPKIEKFQMIEKFEVIEKDVTVEEKITDTKAQNIFVDYKHIGSLFDTYIMIQHEEKILLIDQHVAHEKILYEQILKNIKAQNVNTQTLILPLAIKLQKDEVEIIKNNLEYISKCGYDIDFLTFEDIIIREVPIIFNKPSDEKLFKNIVDKLCEIENQTHNEVMLSQNILNGFYDFKLEAISMISCKNAIKANMKLLEEDVKFIIESLSKLDNPYFCPHGRPIIVEISKNDLEKIFKRG